MTASEKAPTWAYRAGANGVESRLFEDGNVPEGWVDSPAKCVKAEQHAAVQKRTKAKDATG